jgi:hypothetical protein
MPRPAFKVSPQLTLPLFCPTRYLLKLQTLQFPTRFTESPNLHGGFPVLKILYQQTNQRFHCYKTAV